MPDPVQIIAAAITDPPERDGTAGCWWQHKTAMATPAGRVFAGHLAESVVQALTDHGWMITPGWQPAGGALPTAAQIRRWLADHDWTPGKSGSAGALWAPPGEGLPLGVPHDDSDPDALAGTVKRIAAWENLMPGALAREMRQCPGE